MITIVDYQMGNLRSVQKAIEKGGHAATISSDAREISRATHVVLPGVGACGDAIAELKRRDLVGVIRDSIDSGKPFLGICLGLQMLFDQSSENGIHECLGIIPGEVVRFADVDSLKVPHMGWNTVTKTQTGGLLDGIEDGSHFYFVHSYYVRPRDPRVIAMQCDYGVPFCAAVRRDNLFATQFHPEKSQQKGLKLLRDFATLPIQDSTR